MSARSPDLRSLQLLVALASGGSIGAAARQLGVSQPAASQRLRSLERQLGVVLCTRSPTGVAMTPAGEAVADWARQVLDALGRLDLGVEALRADLAGHLTVAASLTVAEHLIPGWLRLLRTETRHGSVTLQVANSSEVQAAVEQRRAVLGFVEGASVASPLRSRVVGEDELVVVVDPRHRWTRRRPPRTDLAELAQTPLVLRETGSGTRQVLEEAVARHHRATPVTDLHVALELGSASLLKSAVLAGEGPGVLSRLAVTDDLAARRLVEVPLDEGPLLRELRAVWRVDTPLTGTAATLLRIASTHRQRHQGEPTAGDGAGPVGRDSRPPS